MIYAYPCQLTSDEDGTLVVTFPDVPEAITGGRDRPEALAMAEDALATALAGYVHEKRDIPPPSERASGRRRCRCRPSLPPNSPCIRRCGRSASRRWSLPTGWE